MRRSSSCGWQDLRRSAWRGTASVCVVAGQEHQRLIRRWHGGGEAARNHSMEEEARQILRAALQEPALATTDLGARIRTRFAGLGDVQLPIDAREPVRPPPVLNKPAAAKSNAASNAKNKPGTPARQRP